MDDDIAEAAAALARTFACYEAAIGEVGKCVQKLNRGVRRLEEAVRTAEKLPHTTSVEIAQLSGKVTFLDPHRRSTQPKGLA